MGEVCNNIKDNAHIFAYDVSLYDFIEAQGEETMVRIVQPAYTCGFLLSKEELAHITFIMFQMGFGPEHPFNPKNLKQGHKRKRGPAMIIPMEQ